MGIDKDKYKWVTVFGWKKAHMKHINEEVSLCGAGVKHVPSWVKISYKARCKTCERKLMKMEGKK